MRRAWSTHCCCGVQDAQLSLPRKLKQPVADAVPHHQQRQVADLGGAGKDCKGRGVRAPVWLVLAQSCCQVWCHNLMTGAADATPRGLLPSSVWRAGKGGAQRAEGRVHLPPALLLRVEHRARMYALPKPEQAPTVVQ